MEALGGFAIAGALIYGGFRVIETGATPGSSSPSLPPSCSPMSRRSGWQRLNIELNSGLVGVRILFEIIDSPPTEPNDDDKPALKITEARVEFNDVRFGYRPGEIVIRGMTFGAEPGKMTALVGPSGGGKSTVFNLILRFYETDAGSIDIDGQNIAGVSRRSLARAGRLCRPGRVSCSTARSARTSPSARPARARPRSRRRQGRACP
jgi:ATP-binding cassette subfamily B protein